MKEILISLISQFGIITVALISSPFISNYFKKYRKVKDNNEYIVKKAKDDYQIHKLCEELRHHYGMDRVMLYYLHNGSYVSNGYSLYKFSCLVEIYDEKLLKPRKSEEQNLPIGMMADFIVHYNEVGIIKCANKETYSGNIKNIGFMLDSLNVKSTYSMAFKDLHGNTTCFLVMNKEIDHKEITDFDYFNRVGNFIGELMTEK